MSTDKKREFCVTFSSWDCWDVFVEAANAEEAVGRAAEVWDVCGPDGDEKHTFRLRDSGTEWDHAIVEEA